MRRALPNFDTRHGEQQPHSSRLAADEESSTGRQGGAAEALTGAMFGRKL
jgi:hypothetical protein